MRPHSWDLHQPLNPPRHVCPPPTPQTAASGCMAPLALPQDMTGQRVEPEQFAFTLHELCCVDQKPASRGQEMFGRI